MLWLASQTPNFLRFLPFGDLLGIRVRKHYSRCRNIWTKIIIFYCLTVLGQEDLVRHYFPILSIKLSWQVNTVRDLSSKVFHRCRNKLFQTIFVHYFVHWRTELLKRKKSKKDCVRFLVPFAGEVCSMKNFPSKLNQRSSSSICCLILMVKENDIYITRRLYWELRKIIL